MAKAVGPLVSCEWVALNLDKVVCVDGTKFYPGRPGYSMEDNGGLPIEEAIVKSRIPNSRYFDIAKWIAPSDDIRMLPTDKIFRDALNTLKIPRDKHLVFYDRVGIWTAPRAWWTFKYFGFDRVSVLDGGFPKWVREGRETESGPVPSFDEVPLIKDDEELIPRTSDVWDYADIKANITKKCATVIDARAAKNFYGTEAQRLEGNSVGHFPQAINIPFTDLTKNGQMLAPKELEEVLRAKGVPLDGSPLVTSCQTATTACIVSLALEILGKPSKLYDGSFSQYEKQKDAVIILEETRDK